MSGSTIINEPNITYNLAGDILAAQNTFHKVLIVGQQFNGSAVSGELTQEIGNDSSEDSVYGIESMLAAMVRAFKGPSSNPLNRVTRVDAIGLVDETQETPQAVSIVAALLVATVTLVAHGHLTGDRVIMEDAVESEYNGTFVITRVDDDTYTYTMSAAPTSPATGSPTAQFFTQATGNVIFTGTTATTSGTLIVTIGSLIDHSYSISVNIGDTPTAIGDKLDILIAADTTKQARSLNNAGDVLIEAVHGGTVGNDLGIKVTGTIDGITHGVVGMSGGLTDPTLTTLFDPVSSIRYQTIIYPSNWDLSTLTDFTEARFNVSGTLLDGEGVITQSDTFANMSTALDSLNEKTVWPLQNVIVNKTSYKGQSCLEMNYTTAAKLGALRSLRLTDGANIADIVIGGGVIDSIGGPALSSKPYYNTPIPLPLIDVGDGLDATQIQTLEAKGGSVFGNNIAHNQVILGPAVTAYKTDSAGNPDPTFHFLNAMDTAVTIREYFFNNTRATFAQSRLTDGDLIPGAASANEQLIRSFLIQLYVDLTKPQFSATRSGEANLTIFKENLVITIDLSVGGVTAEMVVPIVGQFRDFNGLIRIRI